MVYLQKDSGKVQDLSLSQGGHHVDAEEVYVGENAFEGRWYYPILSSQLMA